MKRWAAEANYALARALGKMRNELRRQFPVAAPAMLGTGFENLGSKEFVDFKEL